MSKDTYYHNRMARSVNVGGPFDSLPEELKQRFLDVFHDGLRDSVVGAVSCACAGSKTGTAHQLVRILEFADNPGAMQVIQDVVHELTKKEED